MENIDKLLDEVTEDLCGRYEELSRQEKADILQKINSALEQEPENIDFLLSEAIYYSSEMNHVMAIKILIKILEIDPNCKQKEDVEFWLKLNKEAINCNKTSVPSDDTAFSFLGKIPFQLILIMKIIIVASILFCLI